MVETDTIRAVSLRSEISGSGLGNGTCCGCDDARSVYLRATDEEGPKRKEEGGGWTTLERAEKGIEKKHPTHTHPLPPGIT